MAKKKNFNQSQAIRDALGKKPDGSAADILELVKKANSGAKINEKSFSSQYSTIRKSLGLSKGRDGKATAKKKVAVAARTTGRPRKAEPFEFPTPTAPNLQSISSALDAAGSLIKAAGDIPRAIEFVEDVVALVSVCGDAKTAIATLNACSNFMPTGEAPLRVVDSNEPRKTGGRRKAAGE